MKALKEFHNEALKNEELEANPAGELQDEDLANIAGGGGRKCSACGGSNIVWMGGNRCQCFSELPGVRRTCGFQ